MDLVFIISSIVKMVGFTLLAVMPLVAYSVYAERRVSAIMQDRLGPNRVGIPWTNISLFGLGQPIADGIKFLFKEDLTPGHVNRFYFILAPCLVLVPAFLTAAVLPFGSPLKLPGIEEPIEMVIANLNVGPLFIFAISSLAVYGIVLAGWSSNSKYSFLGGVRSTSQMISYEIALGLSIIPVLLTYGDLSLTEIVRDQSRNGWLLLPFSFFGENDGLTMRRLWLWLPLFVAFIVFIVSIFAETNRAPFDLPECETELVAGYHTEYSSMKFALFFMGEYVALIIGSGLAVTLFFGGWSLPFGLDNLLFAKLGEGNPFLSIIHVLSFFTKTILFILFFIAVRWTVPRFRYDQLMKLGWVFFFEIALVNIILTALILILTR